ncbi:MAG: peptidyl-prolyl cis-trans isomerase, partial [Gammaproteobacteria bacterium]
HQKGAVSDAIRTPRGWLVNHVAEVKPPRVPPLAEVREEVRRSVEQHKRRQQAFARIEKARAEAGAGATLDAIAEKLGVAAQDTPEFGRGPSVPGIGYAPELSKAASTAPVGTLGGPVAVASSAVLYRVSSRTGVDPVQLAHRALAGKRLPRLEPSIESPAVGPELRDVIVENEPEARAVRGVSFPVQSGHGN